LEKLNFKIKKIKNILIILTFGENWLINDNNEKIADYFKNNEAGLDLKSKSTD